MGGIGDAAALARARLTLVACLHDPGARLAAFLERVDAVAAGGSQVVLVDDASSDDTPAALLAFAGRRPEVTVLTNARNAGVARSRNRALTVADREYVWFVDDDDEWTDDAVDVLATAATAATGEASATPSADIVVCRALYVHDPALPGRVIDGVDRRATVSGTELLSLMLRGAVHGFLWSKLIRRELLGTDPFPDISSQSDFVGVTAAAAAATRVVLVPDVLYRYRNHVGSITRVRTPRLENLATARDALLTVVAARPGMPDRRADVEYFTAWFYCAAVAFTPIRQGADHAVRSEGLERARVGLADVRLRRLVRRAPVLAVSMAAVRYAPPVWRIAVPTLLHGQRTLRDLRRAVSARGAR